MLHSVDTLRAIGEYGATLCLGHVLGQCLNDGHALYVDTLYFISIVLRCRAELYHEVQSGVKSLA